jgi:hypothetical protein
MIPPKGRPYFHVLGRDENFVPNWVTFTFALLDEWNAGNLDKPVTALRDAIVDLCPYCLGDWPVALQKESGADRCRKCLHEIAKEESK